MVLCVKLKKVATIKRIGTLPIDTGQIHTN